MADQYAIPLFSGLIVYTIFSLLCSLIDLNDEYYIREVLECLGMFFGVYIGKKLNQQVKVFVTALTGIAGTQFSKARGGAFGQGGAAWSVGTHLRLSFGSPSLHRF